jgi:hypothetical protein
VLRIHSHRTQPHDFEVGVTRERNRREHDMPYDNFILLCDEREDWMCISPENIHQISLSRGFECRLNNSKHSVLVFKFFRPNDHKPPGISLLVSHHGMAGIITFRFYPEYCASNERRYGTISSSMAYHKQPEFCDISMRNSYKNILDKDF